MERDHPVTSFESDDDANKEEKSTKKKQRRIPLPIEKQVQEQLAPFLAEQEKAATEDAGPEKKKKRKKRKKKPADSKRQGKSEDSASDKEPVSADEKAESKEPAEEKPQRKESRKAKQSEVVPEAAELEEAHEVRIEPADEFLGELPVSPRAVREFEERHRSKAEQSEDVPKPASEEPIEIPEIKEKEAEKPKEDLLSKLKRKAESMAAVQSEAPVSGKADAKTEATRSRDVNPAELADPTLEPFAAASESLATPNLRTELAASRSGPERSVLRRNLLVGLLLGGVIEHIRHRKHEKKHAAKQSKEMAASRSDQRDERIRRDEKERTSGRRVTALEKQLARLKAQVQEAVPAAAARAPERYSAPPTPARAERPLAPKNTEARPASYDTKETPEVRAAREKLEQALRAESVQEVEEQQVELPKDRRVDQSAWHRIEVDKKTGRAVENPTLAYGEEFKHEQHQEHLHQPTGDEAAQGDGSVPHSAFPMPTHSGQQQAGGQPQYPAQRPSGTPDRISRPDREGQGLNVNPGALMDIVLWTVLIIIVFAIIATLRS